MKKILGLDLGTNSIGWAIVNADESGKATEIIKLGSRIIPMDAKAMSDFSNGALITQTAVRTNQRGVRRLRERHLLRRERLHRVLNILGFLPEHYANNIDFEKHYGKFAVDIEPKLAYKLDNNTGKYEFIFKNSFDEMINEFKQSQPMLFYKKTNCEETKIPYDWTIYYLRKKALTQKIEKEELAWLILNFNQKRGYYQLRGEDEEETTKSAKTRKYFDKQLITNIYDTNETYKGLKVLIVELADGNKGKIFKKEIPNWIGSEKNIIATVDLDKDGNDKFDESGILSQRFSIPTDAEWESEWKLIKLKTEKDLSDSKKTVGCYIYDTLLQKPDQKIRGKLVRTIERKYYKQELTEILERQLDYHSELKDKDLYKMCLLNLYSNNYSHCGQISNKDFLHLFLNDIIFYQRPLKSKKSLIGTCTYETRTYVKDGAKKTEGVKCIAKSNPLFQEFRLWQFIQNLRIYQKEKYIDGKLSNDVDVTCEFLKTEEDWENIYIWLNERKSIEETILFTSYFKIKKAKGEKELPYRWNYVSDKEYPCNETFYTINSILKKCENIPENFLTKERLFALWHLLYSVEDKYEIEKALKKFAEKNNLGEDFVDGFKKIPPFKKDYGSYSEKAIKKLLPLMKRGKYWDKTAIHPQTVSRINKIIDGEYDEKIRNRVREKAINISSIDDCKNLPLWLACYIVYDRHSEAGDIKQWKTPGDIEWFLNKKNPECFKQHSLRNPVVEQIVAETLRVVKDIWEKYGNGQERFFNEIHVELGREMKNPADKRKKMTSILIENENTNQRTKALLIEMMNDKEYEEVRPFSPNQQEILKIYEEGVLCRYSEAELKNEHMGDVEIAKVAKSASPTKKELEKYILWLSQKYISPYTGVIIPLSKLFTPAYQIEHIIPKSRFYDDSFANKVICEAEVNKDKDNATAYEYIKNNQGKIIELDYGSKVKICKLDEYEKHVKESYSSNRAKMQRLLMEDIPDDFINRQLNDSRYISKVVKNLLSNIVREDNEQETTSKNVLSANGGITNTLKQDWGLNDVWNTIITPRFERMNENTKSENFGSWTNKEGKRVFQTAVPLVFQKGFSKKRIDHRHHALDALVVACANRNHINYLNNESAKSSKKDTRFELRRLLCYKKYNSNNSNNYNWVFYKPWETFTQDSLEQLQATIVSFKQNTRVINKTVNYYQCYKLNEKGAKEKVYAKQTKGENWAIRKSLHKETVSGSVKVRLKKEVSFSNGLKDWKNIVDIKLKSTIAKLVAKGMSNNDIAKYFKSNPNSVNGKIITSLEIYFFTNSATAKRIVLNEDFTHKNLDKVTDSGIKKILENHLDNNLNEKGERDFKAAFCAEGIEKMNCGIKELNGGKQHKPIYKFRVYEEGSKFKLGLYGNKKEKFTEADKGTNLFFAIYWDEKTKKREYETIPLNEAIEHQKLEAKMPKEKRTTVPINKEKGKFLFYLSPEDQVYVPTEEEQANPSLVDLNKLTKVQADRVYKMVSSSGKVCYFVKNQISSLIKSYDAKSKIGELGSVNKLETTLDNKLIIKEVCWKLKVDRLGGLALSSNVII
jgi:CRISPR-associated endonuclease Csn1